MALFNIQFGIINRISSDGAPLFPNENALFKILHFEKSCQFGTLCKLYSNSRNLTLISRLLLVFGLLLYMCLVISYFIFGMLLQCCGCNVFHKLVDNLNLFHEMKCYVNPSFNYRDPKGDVSFKYLDMDDDNNDIFPLIQKGEMSICTSFIFHCLYLEFYF